MLHSYLLHWHRSWNNKEQQAPSVSPCNYKTWRHLSQQRTTCKGSVLAHTSTSWLSPSFRYGTQWAQGSGCLMDGEVLDGNFRHKGHSPASVPAATVQHCCTWRKQTGYVSPVHASVTLVIMFHCYCVGQLCWSKRCDCDTSLDVTYWTPFKMLKWGINLFFFFFLFQAIHFGYCKDSPNQ